VEESVTERGNSTRAGVSHVETNHSLHPHVVIRRGRLVEYHTPTYDVVAPPVLRLVVVLSFVGKAREGELGAKIENIYSSNAGSGRARRGRRRERGGGGI
jgi:hypothetical protein